MRLRREFQRLIGVGRWNHSAGRRVQDQQNHFERFGLPVQFQLDLQKLSERYRALQQRFHPDRFAGSTKQEQLLSVQYSANLNEAFDTLKSSVNRAHYLLRLMGKPVDEEAQREQLDPCFLMRQMELREDLDAIRGAEYPEGALEALRTEVRREISELETVISKQFAQQTDEGCDKAARLSLELQFLVKLDAEIDALESELLD